MFFKHQLQNTGIEKKVEPVHYKINVLGRRKCCSSLKFIFKDWLHWNNEKISLQTEVGLLDNDLLIMYWPSRDRIIITVTYKSTFHLYGRRDTYFTSLWSNFSKLCDYFLRFSEYIIYFIKSSYSRIGIVYLKYFGLEPTSKTVFACLSFSLPVWGGGVDTSYLHFLISSFLCNEA